MHEGDMRRPFFRVLSKEIDALYDRIDNEIGEERRVSLLIDVAKISGVVSALFKELIESTPREESIPF